MAISQSDLNLYSYSTGELINDGEINNLFADGRVGNAADYAFVTLHNDHATLTLTSVKMWLLTDSGGGTFAIAEGSTTILGVSQNFDAPDPSTLTYTTPSSQSGGISLPNIAAQSKALIAIKRDLSSASVEYPEANRLYVAGTSNV